MPNDSKVFDVLHTIGCNKHNADKGVPCWTIHSLFGRKKSPAVCNRRAVRSGFNAPIDPRSLTRKRPAV